MIAHFLKETLTDWEVLHNNLHKIKTEQQIPWVLKMKDHYWFMKILLRPTEGVYIAQHNNLLSIHSLNETKDKISTKFLKLLESERDKKKEKSKTAHI